jgi:hypothetical protein
VYTETVSCTKKKDYQRFTLYLGNEGSKHHRQSTGGCVRLALISIFTRLQSSLLLLSNIVYSKGEHLWYSTSVRKVWMQRPYSGLGYKHLSNFSWSSFISTWILIKYKFIPTHNYHKEIDKICHKHMASITREHDLSPSSSSIIMWGSRPPMTVGTAN